MQQARQLICLHAVPCLQEKVLKTLNLFKLIFCCRDIKMYIVPFLYDLDDLIEVSKNGQKGLCQLGGFGVMWCVSS